MHKFLAAADAGIKQNATRQHSSLINVQFSMMLPGFYVITPFPLRQQLQLQKKKKYSTVRSPSLFLLHNRYFS